MTSRGWKNAKSCASLLLNLLQSRLMTSFGFSPLNWHQLRDKDSACGLLCLLRRTVKKIDWDFPHYMVSVIMVHLMPGTHYMTKCCSLPISMTRNSRVSNMPDFKPKFTACWSLIGWASWYYSRLHGKPSASKEFAWMTITMDHKQLNALLVWLFHMCRKNKWWVFGCVHSWVVAANEDCQFYKGSWRWEISMTSCFHVHSMYNHAARSSQIFIHFWSTALDNISQCQNVLSQLFVTVICVLVQCDKSARCFLLTLQVQLQ